MNEQRSRPGGQSQAAPEVLGSKTILLPADRAHLFGVGMPVTERRALSRRVLRQLVTSGEWETVYNNFIRRSVHAALMEALPEHWLARAESLETVGTPEADEAARNCRAHAWILATSGMPADLAAEVDEVLDHLAGEVA